MKTYKVIEYQEVNDALNIDFIEYLREKYHDNIMNDTAIRWYVEIDNDADKTDIKIYNFFISQGCKDGEKIYIDICW